MDLDDNQMNGGKEQNIFFINVKKTMMKIKKNTFFNHSILLCNRCFIDLFENKIQIIQFYNNKNQLSLFWNWKKF